MLRLGIWLISCDGKGERGGSKASAWPVNYVHYSVYVRCLFVFSPSVRGDTLTSCAYSSPPCVLVFSAASTQRTTNTRTNNTAMPVSSSIYRYLGVAVLASLVQHFIRTQQLHGPVGMCSQSDDERSDWIEVDEMNASSHSNNKTNRLLGKIRARPCQAFSESYFEARAKFRVAKTTQSILL